MRRWSSAESSRRPIAPRSRQPELRRSTRRGTSNWPRSWRTSPTSPRPTAPADKPVGCVLGTGGAQIAPVEPARGRFGYPGYRNRARLDAGWEVAVNPAFQRRARLEAGDEGVPGGVAIVHDDVPQALRVDDETGAAVQGHAHLRVGVWQAVGAVVHQQHVAVGVVGQLQPGPHDPTLVRRVESIVVVAMDRGNRLLAALRFELDHPDPAEIGTDGVDV